MPTLAPPHDPHNPLVTVFPRLSVPSWPKIAGRIHALDQALRHRWQTDAMYAGYLCAPPTIPGESDGWESARATIAGHRANGTATEPQPPVSMRVVALDYDRPLHAPWDSGQQAQDALGAALTEIHAHAPGDLPLFAYTTRAGLRLIFALSEVATPDQASATRTALVRRLATVRIGDLSDDANTKDWNRLMRLPLVVREDYGPTWEPFAPFLVRLDTAVPLPVADFVESPHVPLPRRTVDETTVLEPAVALPSVAWQTTTEAEIPPAAAVDATEALQAVWVRSSADASGVADGWSLTPVAAQVLDVFGARNLGEVRGSTRRHLILHSSDAQTNSIGFPQLGERNLWTFQTMSDLCEAAVMVRGGTPAIAYGLGHNLFARVTELLGADQGGATWEDTARKRLPDLWAKKRHERILHMAFATPTPVDLAAMSISAVVREPLALAQVAAAKQQPPAVIVAWERCAHAVGRGGQTVDGFLDWFQNHAIAARPGASGEKGAMVLDPDHGRYVSLGFAATLREIHQNAIYSPLRPYLFTAVKDENGELKIVGVSKPEQWPVWFVDEDWPGNLPIYSPRAYHVDRRQTSRGMVYRMPTLWHQIDRTLEPRHDPDFARLLRYFFGTDWNSYGRYYFLQLIVPDISKSALLLHGEGQIGKSRFIQSVAALYGKPSAVRLKPGTNKWDANPMFGTYTAEALAGGPVVTLDDSEPTPAHVEFVMSSLGGTLPSYSYRIMRQDGTRVEMAPVIIFANNSIDKYVEAIRRSCTSEAQLAALRSRMIACRPDGSLDEWARTMWAKKFHLADGAESVVHRRFAEHMLWEGLSAQSEGVGSPSDSHRGGGNAYLTEVTKMDVTSDAVEGILTALTAYLGTEDFRTQILSVPGTMDGRWLSSQADRKRETIKVPDSFGPLLEMPSTNAMPGWVLGRWWFVRPGRIPLILERGTINGGSWIRKAETEGVSWVVTSSTRISVVFRGEETKSHRVGIVDLFAFADSVGVMALSPPVQEHLKRIGYVAPRAT